MINIVLKLPRLKS